MNTYVFGLDFGTFSIEVNVDHMSEKQARKELWDFVMNESQRNTVASIELLDVL